MLRTIATVIFLTLVVVLSGLAWNPFHRRTFAKSAAELFVAIGVALACVCALVTVGTRSVIHRGNNELLPDGMIDSRIGKQPSQSIQPRRETGPNITSRGSKAARTKTPDILMEECKHLVQGQLLFSPTLKMRQGQTYFVYARLARGTDPAISRGQNGSDFIVEDAEVSCKAEIDLSSEEPNAFSIQEIPPNGTRILTLPRNQYMEWDWNVQPLKSGTLHLLLYISPIIHIDGIQQDGEIRINEPPRIITVSPNRLFELKNTILEHWPITTFVLASIVFPLIGWIVSRRITSRR